MECSASDRHDGPDVSYSEHEGMGEGVMWVRKGEATGEEEGVDGEGEGKEPVGRGGGVGEGLLLA